VISVGLVEVDGRFQQSKGDTVKNHKKELFRLLTVGSTVAALVVAGMALGAAPASAADVPPTLQSGLGLHPGGAITSHGNQYVLLMRTDGNLVELAGDRVLWSTGTNGNPGASFTVQWDGNAVVYSNTGKALWSTQTSVKQTIRSEFRVGMDGNVSLKNQNGKVVWQNGAPGTNILGGSLNVSFLNSGWYLHAGNAKLIMQSDGNLVSYRDGKAVWWTRTGGNAKATAEVTSQGDFSVKSELGRYLWSSLTAGQGGPGTDYKLVLGTNGTLTLSQGAKVIWRAA
jgi:pseudomonalisin